MSSASFHQPHLPVFFFFSFFFFVATRADAHRQLFSPRFLYVLTTHVTVFVCYAELKG